MQKRAGVQGGLELWAHVQRWITRPSVQQLVEHMFKLMLMLFACLNNTDLFTTFTTMLTAEGHMMFCRMNIKS